jgi:NADP-dependent 3-hydroxy acid dehydrogenase YdfG
MAAAAAVVQKVALVTGASSGIGRATALAFAKAGYRVVAAARNLEVLTKVCDTISETGGEASHVVLDVTDVDSCRAAAEHTVSTFGRIDCLVNAAGVLRGGHVDKIGVDNWDFNMNINGRGAFCMMTACIPALKETKGNVVHVSECVRVRTQEQQQPPPPATTPIITATTTTTTTTTPTCRTTTAITATPTVQPNRQTKNLHHLRHC